MVKKIIFIILLSYSLGSVGQNYSKDSFIKELDSLPWIQVMVGPIFRKNSKMFSYEEARDSILKDIDFNYCLKEEKRSIIIYCFFWVEKDGSTTGHRIIYKDSIRHEGLTFDPDLNELLLKRLKALHFDQPALVRADQPVRFWVMFPLKGIKKKIKKNDSIDYADLKETINEASEKLT